MKKTFLLLMLLSGITGSLCAQNKTNEEKMFELAPDATDRKFFIDLGQGNKMEISLKDIEDLTKFKNMDSLIYGFLQDLKLLKDSLNDETTVKRIDYNIDDAENHKIRLLEYRTKGSNFLVRDGELSNLKLELDTINFVGKTVYRAKYTMRNAFTDTRYFKVSFFLNDVRDIGKYMNGTLSTKINTLHANVNDHWNSKGGNKYYYLKADSSIHANANKGYVAGGDFLGLHLSVDFQNYKNFFVPSVSYGLNFIFASKNFKREVGLTLEDHFSFAKNSAGTLKTFRDEFLTLSVAHGPIKDNDPKKESYQLANFTLGYLIRNKGNIYEKNTIRLGAGALSLFEGKTKIQPMIYFNNFFRAVTPGIRWTQSF